MAKDFERMEDSNRSASPSIHEISDPSRSVLLRAADRSGVRAKPSSNLVLRRWCSTAISRFRHLDTPLRCPA